MFLELANPFTGRNLFAGITALVESRQVQQITRVKAQHFQSHEAYVSTITGECSLSLGAIDWRILTAASFTTTTHIATQRSEAFSEVVYTSSNDSTLQVICRKFQHGTRNFPFLTFDYIWHRRCNGYNARKDATTYMRILNIRVTT